MSERDKIVAWVQREAARIASFGRKDNVLDVPWAVSLALRGVARSIENGEHLKRPEPTIPASEWVKTPSVGH